MNVILAALSCATTRAHNKSSSSELCLALTTRRLAVIIERVVLLDIECSPQHPPHSIAILAIRVD
jgi:hypothetical protein